MKLFESACPKCGKISPRQLGQVSFGNALNKCLFCGTEYYLDLTEVALKKGAEEKRPKEDILKAKETVSKINYKLLSMKEDEIRTELDRRNRDEKISGMSFTLKEILSKSTFAEFSTEELENELLRRRKM